MNSAPNIGLLPLQLIYVNQGRWKPLNCGCAAYLVDQDFSGQNLSLNKERSQKSGCAAAHPVPPALVIIPRCSICNHESHLIKSQIVHIRAPKEPVLRGTLLIQVASYVSWVEKPSGLWANVFSRRIQPYLPPLELFSGLPSSPCWSSNVWLGVSWPAEKNFKVSSRTLASPLTPLGSKKIQLK